jgi:Tfp pilus assembly protein FimV
MQAPIVLFSLCLLLALAVPSWGGNKKNCSPKPSQQVTVPPTPVVSTGAYKRDPSKVKETQQYLKSLQQKAKQAAANQAAARAKLAGPETTTPPQPTEGGTK